MYTLDSKPGMTGIQIERAEFARLQAEHRLARRRRIVRRAMTSLTALVVALIG